MSYVDNVIEQVKEKNPNEPEFLQAVGEVLGVPAAGGGVRTRGYEPRPDVHRADRGAGAQPGHVPRALGGRPGQRAGQPGLPRAVLHRHRPLQGRPALPSLRQPGIIKFLGFEQVFKNCLTGLPMGGGKGGCDFDPKGKSDNEVMRFCQCFMTELQRHIGADTDVPAGDIGAGAREMGYMFGQYKRIRNEFERRAHRQGPELRRLPGPHRGHRLRPVLLRRGDAQVPRTVLPGPERRVISGSGNVAIYANQKASSWARKVVAMRDSTGWIVRPGRAST